MIKLSEKGRRILRAIYRGLGVTAVTLVFHSCDSSGNVSSGWAAYGMPPTPPERQEEVVIHGSIISKETREPIPRIYIGIDEFTYSFARFDGQFYIYAPKQDNYEIIFTDIDYTENGGLFKPHKITLTMEEAENFTEENPLIIELEKVTEEDD